MGLIDIASSKSAWRGYEYYLNEKVHNYKRINEYHYESKVNGNSKKPYNVFIDVKHPRKSKCDCPHAKDRRIICKHIVALYFQIFPKEATKYIKEIEEYEKEEDQRLKELDKKIIKYINSLSKEELKKIAIELLYDNNEWTFNRFVRDRIDY